MKALLQFGSIFLILSVSVSMNLSRASDPHTNDLCAWSSCHTRDPAGGTVELLGDSIDDTCCLCHTEKCSLSQGTNHISNIDQWDEEEFTDPRSLPLYDGYITCMTCHYRKTPQGGDYKMIRIVTLKENGATWTELCRDCHAHH